MAFSMDNIKRILTQELKEHDKEYQMDFHFKIVKKYADKLAKMYNANTEVLEIAVWLHDLARISGEKDHSSSGAERAAALLKQMHYPADVIEKVTHCILTHSCTEHKPQTIEAKILASADAMSHFDVIPVMVWLTAKQTGMTAKEVIEYIHRRIEHDWNKKLLLPEAKEMVKDKYIAAKILFKELV